MTPTTSREESNYRWLILVMLTLTGFVAMGFPTTALPVLFDEISDELGLTLFQVGVIWGIGSFMGIFTALLSGPLIDYIGTRRAIVLICLLMGITGALRSLSNGFLTLVFFSFLFGCFQPMIPVNLIKLNRLWFGSHQLGLASGIMSSGFALGLLSGARLSATVLSPELDGWRNVLLAIGIAGFGLGILWWLVYPSEYAAPTSSLDFASLYRQILEVARFRYLWTLGGVGLGIAALMRGVVGYVPSYLREIGWSGVDADSAISVFFLASLIGVVPLGVLSDRLGNRRSTLMFTVSMMTCGITLMYVVGGHYQGVMLAMAVAGCSFDGFMAIHAAAITEVEGITTVMMGTAIGFALMIRNIGATLGPPLGNSFAGIGLDTPFLVWAACGLLALVLLARPLQPQQHAIL